MLRKVLLVLLLVVVVGACVYLRIGDLRIPIGVVGHRLGEMQVAQNKSEVFVLVDEDEIYRWSRSPEAPNAVYPRLISNRIVVLGLEGVTSARSIRPGVTVNSNLSTLFGHGDDLLLFEGPSPGKAVRLCRVTPEGIQPFTPQELAADKPLGKLFRRLQEADYSEVRTILDEAATSSPWQVVYDSNRDYTVEPPLELLDGKIEISGDWRHLHWHEVIATWKESGKSETIAADSQILPANAGTGLTPLPTP